MQRVLIVGAARGIGLELLKQYRAEGAAVTGTARSSEGLRRIAALGATALALDVGGGADELPPPWLPEGAAFDIAIVAAGVYGPRTGALQPPRRDEFDAVMHVNVWGAMRVVATLAAASALAPGARLAVLSSRMGSLGLRSNASGWLYRASKAALNSILKDASIELEGRAICVALHPGWVRTDMGGSGADLSVQASAADLRRTLAALRPADNGRFFNHDGTALAW